MTNRPTIFVIVCLTQVTNLVRVKMFSFRPTNLTYESDLMQSANKFKIADKSTGV